MTPSNLVTNLAAAVACTAAVASAQTTAPSTAPAATRPATAPATTQAAAGTLDTPKDAMRWFAAALRDGDVGRLRAVLLPANPAEDRMIAAVGGMAAALGNLRRTVTAAYGPDEAWRFADDAAAQFQETLARIDAAEVTVAGDAATLRYAEAKDAPVTLHKVDGAWRVPAEQFAKGADAPALDRRVAELLVQRRVVDELSADVAAGKYKSAEAAALGWRTKMMSALGTAPAPATTPATGPQTRPATRQGAG